MQGNNNRQRVSLGSRRAFLRSAAATAAGYVMTRPNVTGPPLVAAANKTASQARLRPDLLDESSPEALEVVQLTSDPEGAGLASLHGGTGLHDGLAAFRVAPFGHGSRRPPK